MMNMKASFYKNIIKNNVYYKSHINYNILLYFI